MAKLLYTGTNFGADSGYFRRYFSEFVDARGVLFRLEILDSVFTSTGFNFSNDTPQEFDLGRDGVTISWDGSGDDLHEAVISSSLTADFLLAGTRHWIFPEVLAGSEEDRFLIALFRFEPTPNSTLSDPDGSFRPEWFGVLSPEGTEYVSNESNEFLRISAHCGLASLNDVPYQDDNGDPYTTDDTLAGHLSRVLAKMPTAPLWSYGSGNGTAPLADNNSGADVYLLREVSYLGPGFTLNAVTNVPDAYSVLTSVKAKAAAFYEIETSTDQFGGTFATKTTSTCGQVLQSIVSVLGMRIFQSEGSFWAIHWAALDDRNPFVHAFRSPGHLTTRSKTQIGIQVSDFELDLDANKFEAIRGLSTRYLFPIQRAVSVHTKGGSTILVSGNSTHSPIGGQAPESSVYHLTHQAANAEATLSSDSASVLGGDSPVMRGEVRGLPTGQGTGAFDLDAAGMKTIIEMTIKVGDYYLKRNLTSYSADSADLVNIHRTAATDLDYMDLIQDGAVVWTTTPSTYSIATPFIGQGSPEPPVVLQGTNDDIQRVGGYHLDLRDNEIEFTFTGTTFGDGTTDGRTASFSIDWTLPGLPDNVSEHVGVEFSAVVRYYSRTNVEITPSTIAALDALNGQAGRIAEFKLFSTNDTGEEDVVFVADVNANRAIVKVAETILGDSYTGADSVGALRVWNFNSSAWGSSFSDTWRTMDDTTTGKFIHEQLAHLGLQERAKVLRKISGTFAFDTSQRNGPNLVASNLARKIPSFRHLFAYTIGASSKAYAAQSLQWSVRSTAFDFEGFLVDVDRTLEPANADDTRRDVTGGGTSTTGDTPTGGGIAAELYAVRSDIGTGGNGNGGLTAEEQAKLNAITLDASNRISSFLVGVGAYPLDSDELNPAFTINASDQLTALAVEPGTQLLTADQIDDASTAHKFATSGQLSQITANQNAISTNTSAISSNSTSISTLQSGVSTNTSAIANLTSDQVDDSSSTTHKFATSSQLLQISTNVSDISALESDVTQIQTILKDTSGGGGIGVYTDSSKATTSSYLGLSSTESKLQAGGGTSFQATEQSPGRLSMNVAAGPAGSETEFEAMRIQGGTTTGRATITFAQGADVVGISATDLSDVTSAGSGQIITSAERTKLQGVATGAEVNVLSDWTATTGDAVILNKPTIPEEFADLAGNADDIPEGQTNKFFTDSERTKLSGIAAGAEVNVVETNLSTADQTIANGTTRKINLGTSGTLVVGSGSSNVIQAMRIVGSSTIPAIEFTGSVKMDSGTMAGGSIRLEEFGGAGQSAVTIKAPTSLSADVDFVLPSADGTNGQALITDGSGNLSFSTISGGGGGSSTYVVASSSTRVPLYWAGRYYFGSTSYGWDTDTGYSYGSVGKTYIVDDYAHLGIVAPSAISSLSVHATMRNDTAAEDCEIYVFRGSRPNGSTSSITLTQLLTATASNSSGQDRHYNADATTSSAGISAGDLIFVAFRRTGTTNGTQYLNVSYTITAQ